MKSVRFSKLVRNQLNSKGMIVMIQLDWIRNLEESEMVNVLNYLDSNSIQIAPSSMFRDHMGKTFFYMGFEVYQILFCAEKNISLKWYHKYVISYPKGLISGFWLVRVCPSSDCPLPLSFTTFFFVWFTGTIKSPIAPNWSSSILLKCTVKMHGLKSNKNLILGVLSQR